MNFLIEKEISKTALLEVINVEIIIFEFCDFLQNSRKLILSKILQTRISICPEEIARAILLLFHLDCYL